MTSEEFWEWPQYAYLAFTLVGIGIVAASEHGVHFTRIGAILGSVPAWTFLLFGGFFN